MKKSIPMLMLLAAAFLSSCGDDDLPTCRVSSMTYDGNPYMDYMYDDQLLLLKSVSYANGQEDMEILHTRNPDNTVHEFIYVDNGDTVARQLMTYSSGRPIKMDYFIDQELDGTFDLFLFSVYTYNAEGKVISTDFTDNNAQTVSFTYEWTGNNLTRQTYPDGSYKEMQYDEHFSRSWPYFESYVGSTGDFGSSLSENNAILYTTYDDQGVLQTSTSVVYTYNDEGFVVTSQSSQSSAITAYAYDCD